MTTFLIVFIFGAVVGSFLNVCIYRIPRSKSIIFPSSTCPYCNMPIRPYDNIPLVSYFILGGECRHCNGKISFRYPMVELLNAIMYGVMFWKFGLHPYTFVYMFFSSSLIVITFIDLDFQIIPDVITLPGIVAGLGVAAFILIDPYNRSINIGIINSLIGAVAGGGLFYLIAVISKGGMGGGDIKLMGMLGTFLGWKGVLMTTFVASLSGTLVGIFLIVLKGKGRKTKIPFGPFLALGAMISLLFGQEILRIYLHGRI